MNRRILRYVGDIEVPEGVASIDCEVRIGEKTEVLFILNRSTCDRSRDKQAGSLRDRLETRGEFLVQTEAKDPKTFIVNTLASAYGPEADITLSETDTD